MSEVNVTELRQHLPAYLKRVRKGERIRVTARGRVIAEIGPPTATADGIEAARAHLRGSLVLYEAPFDPAVPPEEWEVNR